MTYRDLVDALFYGRPGEPFQCLGFDTDEVTDPPAIVWEGEQPVPTLDEIQAWSLEVALERARAAKCVEIKAALTASDLWAIRNAEDGYSLTPERRGYRDALRVLLGKVATSKKPDALALPDLPPYPDKPS